MLTGPNLTKLGLSSNQIVDIAPLSSLANITELYLNSNQIADITPLADLANLIRLELKGNPITDLSPLIENLFLDHETAITLTLLDPQDPGFDTWIGQVEQLWMHGMNVTVRADGDNLSCDKLYPPNYPRLTPAWEEEGVLTLRLRNPSGALDSTTRFILRVYDWPGVLAFRPVLTCV